MTLNRLIHQKLTSCTQVDVIFFCDFINNLFLKSMKSGSPLSDKQCGISFNERNWFSYVNVIRIIGEITDLWVSTNLQPAMNMHVKPASCTLHKFHTKKFEEHTIIYCSFCFFCFSFFVNVAQTDIDSCKLGLFETLNVSHGTIITVQYCEQSQIGSDVHAYLTGCSISFKD